MLAVCCIEITIRHVIKAFQRNLTKQQAIYGCNAGLGADYLWNHWVSWLGVLLLHDGGTLNLRCVQKEKFNKVATGFFFHFK
jgi:hypothetical protein